MDSSRTQVAVLLIVVALAGRWPPQAAGRHETDSATRGPAWAELEKSMAKMHADMKLNKPSGDDDVDFVNLMLPHHEAAIEMAKTELLYGKDQQMRRLAQEIITDQQSEAELMRLWRKQHETKSQN